MAPLRSLARRLRPRPAQDERTRAGRLAGMLYAVATSVSLVIFPLWPTKDNTWAQALTSSAVGYLMAAGIAAIPWRRFPHWVLGVLPGSVVAVYIGNAYTIGHLDYFMLFSPLPFVFTGMVFRRGACALLGVVFVAAYPLSLLGKQDSSVTALILFTVSMNILFGEIIANLQNGQRRTLVSMRHLLDAATSLGTVSGREDVGDVVAPILGRLLAAEAAAVRLDGPEGTVLREWVLVRDVAPAWDDVLPPAGQPFPTQTIEARDSQGEHRWNVLAVPILETGGVRGTLAAAFGAGRAPDDGLTRQMVEVLADEVARVLRRLDHTDDLSRQARTDPLTGLGNRVELAAALARVQPGDAFLICDLDHFKKVNDTHGHAVGDQVLMSFAKTLRDVVRGHDVVCRYGGEEFAIVLPKAQGEGPAREVVARIRRAWNDTDPITSFSSGLAVFDGGDPQATVEAADAALYRAKEAGRNRDELATRPVGSPA